jgi:RecB family exonuclease
MTLEPGASYDRGAERLVRQTRFLAAAFREFERRSLEAGTDEHGLRERLRTTAAARPFRHVVVTAGDRAFDSHGLPPAFWDTLARLPGLRRLDVVVTENILAGALHERLHQVLPGIEEVHVERRAPAREPWLDVPSSSSVVHVARDREDEVAAFARRVKPLARQEQVPLDRIALVVRQPLPYVYVAREVLRSAGIPCQMFDALPLATEPYAAALDLVFSFVSANFSRGPAVALLRSPHFRFLASTATRPEESAPHAVIEPRDVPALDRALAESGYLGDIEALERLVTTWQESERAKGAIARAASAGGALLELARSLAPLRQPQPAAVHLRILLEFVGAWERMPPGGDPLRARHLRARAAILGTADALRSAYEAFDPAEVSFDDVAALLRRWIDGQTFAPRSGDAGVHLVDATSARYGRFDVVQIAGVVEGEWPDAPRRNIFYSPSLLRQLGWPAESERIDGARAAFADLLRLPSSRVAVSAFSLESDALVSPSPFVDAIERAGLEPVESAPAPARIFEHEALALEPVTGEPLGTNGRSWLELRLEQPAASDVRYRGYASDPALPAYSLSALERYQDCPFKFFATDVLRLDEAPEDESALSPRARGRFIHEVFQRFFEAWDARGLGTITVERVDEAHALFAEVAAPLLARLPDSDAALEHTRLFGSAIAMGIVDTVLALEATRPLPVHERWLEYRLEGRFALGGEDGRQVPLKGVADRIDLLDGRRLRVIDYKSGYAPNPRRALQVPIYALCAQERLQARDSLPWAVDDASYVAFTGRRSLVPVVKGGSNAGDALSEARARVFAVADGIGRGEFPPRPHDPMLCRTCAHAAVCRKDYAGD